MCFFCLFLSYFLNLVYKISGNEMFSIEMLIAYTSNINYSIHSDVKSDLFSLYLTSLLELHFMRSSVSLLRNVKIRDLQSSRLGIRCTRKSSNIKTIQFSLHCPQGLVIVRHPLRLLRPLMRLLLVAEDRPQLLLLPLSKSKSNHTNQVYHLFLMKHKMSFCPYYKETLFYV